ncbi:hypothetical protein SAMN04488524_3945 [Pedobacter africanus]|uniref:Uncharacterized protein n=1 Tax=Pedobacter africanus TaxID=151894 RepID=A0A1W2DKW7_9SPHI|nr:hypothetical protein SAMN04488524_3945 [Pedobacter africanus]
MKNFKMLSKAEMRKIAGGTGDPCMVDADCPSSLCIDGICSTLDGECRDNCGGELGSCPRSDEVCKTATCTTSQGIRVIVRSCMIG